MRHVFVATLLLCAAVRADDFPRVYERATYLGFSKKHQQFAVRRALTFMVRSTSASGAADAGFVEFPKNQPTRPSSCNRVCRDEGRACAQDNDPAHQHRMVVGEWNGPKRAEYTTSSCTEPMTSSNKGADALMKKSKLPAYKTGFCWCDAVTAWRGVEGGMITADIVEVYNANGTLKRSFLEKTRHPDLIAKLKANPSSAPVDDAADPWLQRELTDGDKWRAYQADGEFKVEPPAPKAGKCELDVRVKLNAECNDHEGTECTDVDLAVKGLPGTPGVGGGSVDEAVKSDAWWTPGPKPSLVVIMHWTKRDGMDDEAHPRDDLVVVPSSKLEGCTK